MNLAALPAFSDAHIWMLDDGQRPVVVAPGDSGPVIDALEQRSLQLARILVTRHRGDYVRSPGARRRQHKRASHAHQYTLSGLRFSMAAEGRRAGPRPPHVARRHGPERPARHRTVTHCNAMPHQPLPVRADIDAIGNELAHGADGRGAVDVFSALREWKNRFR
jgi:hypothetical protein